MDSPLYPGTVTLDVFATRSDSFPLMKKVLNIEDDRSKIQAFVRIHDRGSGIAVFQADAEFTPSRIGDPEGREAGPFDQIPGCLGIGRMPVAQGESEGHFGACIQVETGKPADLEDRIVFLFAR